MYIVIFSKCVTLQSFILVKNMFAAKNNVITVDNFHKRNIIEYTHKYLSDVPYALLEQHFDTCHHLNGL